MQCPDYQHLLQFSDPWLQLGLLSEDELCALGREYESSDDKNPEHYCYKVFSDYLTSHSPLPPAMTEALYDLGAEDPDQAMGQAMMSTIVGLAECPARVLEKGSASGEKHLVRAANRRRLLTELNSGLTAELFTRCLESQDSVVQRKLLARPQLSREQLEKLAEARSSRVVQNLAVERLRARRCALK
jgi:hypothetical protein